jgi:type III pantothenate kinase
MELVLDFGNTNKKLALFRNGKLRKLVAFPGISLAIVKEFLRENPGIDRAILSSVVEHPSSIERFLGCRMPLVILDENTPIPVTNRYLSPHTLGKDRLAAAVGGFSLYPGKDVLVINTGTCITYDFVSRDKEYLGGAISPGMEMRFRALHTFTGKLPLISRKKDYALIGKDTPEAILSGVVNGMIGEIEHVAGQYQALYPDLVIILSGGDMKYFEKRLKIGIFAVPNIVIHGLYQILSVDGKNGS